MCCNWDNSFMFNFLDQVNLTECACTNACSELEYESSVSYSKFPDESLIAIVHHLLKFKHSPDYMR